MAHRSDAVLAVRNLRKQPGLTAAVVLTLGVAVGAAAIIFAVSYQALFRPLPYRDPSKLLLLWEKSVGGDLRLASYPVFLDWQRLSRAFASVGYARGRLDVLAKPDGPVRATTAFTSPSFLSETLGATPLLGRFFTADEEAAGRGDAAVLSERFWRAQFGGDPKIVGTSVMLSGRAVTVVGVLPAAMTYPPWADLWRPVSAIVDADSALASRHHHTDSRVLARLASGVTRDAALADLASVQRRLATTYADHGAEWTSADSKALDWEFVGDARPALGTLAGAVALTLLVACVNVATLVLLRALSRERELAIRAALGASRRGLVRLTLAESAVLGVCAAVLALVLAWTGLAFIRAAAPGMVPRAGELVFDARAAALVVVLTTAAMLVSSAPSALRVLRAATFESLRAGWQPTSGGRGGGRVRAGLVIAQLAIALTLVAGAGLLIESFRQLRRVDLGFDPDRLAAFWIAPPSPKYDAPAEAAALYARLAAVAAAVPGVEGVAISNHIALGGGWVASKFIVPGRETAADGSDAALYKTVSDDYLRVMRGRLLRGRWFTDADIRGAGNAVVVNEQLARRVWPDKDPVGQPITLFRSSQARAGYGDPVASAVVGVVADMHHISVADDPVPEVYVPYTREVWPGIALLIRTKGDPRTIERALRRAVLEVEPALPVASSVQWRTFVPIGDNVARLLAPRRTVVNLVLVFAGVALTLAAIGVYGVMAFGVAQRMREFGVRMAVGATSRDVVALILRQSAKLATVGAAAGIVGGLALARVLRASLDSVLYRTSPFAVAPLAAAAAVLACVAVAAAWVPARRAAGADPLIALRSE
jgi:predicted permease